MGLGLELLSVPHRLGNRERERGEEEEEMEAEEEEKVGEGKMAAYQSRRGDGGVHDRVRNWGAGFI